MPLWDYTLGTFLGLIPRTLAAAFTAASLEQLHCNHVTDQRTLVAGIVATIIVCFVLGVFANRALRTLTAPQNAT